MLQLADEALDPENAGANTPRDSVFEIKRPYIGHLEVPEGIDYEFHLLMKDLADKESDPDSDDEEAGGPSGRISPCTFLAWSKDCQRWDSHVDELVYPDKVREPP